MNEHLKPDEIEMLQRAEKATKGPWRNDDPSWKELNDITVWAPGEDVSVCNMGGSFAACGDRKEADQNFDNGEFVAAARTDLPTILTRLANERAKLAIAMEALEKTEREMVGLCCNELARAALARINELEKQSW